MTSQLNTLLAKWREQNAPGFRDEKLAHTILETATRLIGDNNAGASNDEWKEFLRVTHHYRFLQSLKDRNARRDWADVAIDAISVSQYGLLDMFDDRCRAVPANTLFTDVGGVSPAFWTYKLIRQRVRSIAATFYEANEQPRVAILANNSVDAACCDLACLFYDILVSPLNIHFDADVLKWVFDELKINIAVVDSVDQVKKLAQIRDAVGQPFKIFALTPLGSKLDAEAEVLPRVAMRLTESQVEDILSRRRIRHLTEVCTVMFTSGSTGMPKGVSFSGHNLITKRFARAAALPNVGHDELLICFLPLYHTFGRFFEMLGMIYWSGTYVFPGNTSAETLLTLMSKLNPTGLISIPLRWQQVEDRCLAEMGRVVAKDEKGTVFRRVVGRRLRWGLSAAGYLAPKVFRFFNHNGVALCSGFGMTEATGGITMTPPGEFVENSIGVPLPGVKTRLTSEGELEIAGAYVARYLEEAGPGDPIPDSCDEKDEYWLPTGDLFRELEDGHLEIVDRLKDIYKNSKGQTTAPRRVDKEFEGVPGIKQTFLVGDAREYNVLLIVPDLDDAVHRGLESQHSLLEYYRQIISNVNSGLAPYERVVDCAVLERGFELEREELTPKGSYRRKSIQTNFKEVIDQLYRSRDVELVFDTVSIKIPRWFFRDLGILEGDIEIKSDGLYDRRNKRLLPIEVAPDRKSITLGNLSYKITGTRIDMRLLAHQPMLWMGNPDLINFCPCRVNWDLSLGPFTGEVALPGNHDRRVPKMKIAPLRSIEDPRLSRISHLSMLALFANTTNAVNAVKELDRALRDSDERIARAIRLRLSALANHDAFEVRSLVFRVLLMDEPSPDYSKMLPAFIQSGLPFLNENSIRDLAGRDFKKRRLQEFRQRMFTYRTGLDWPAEPITRQQFEQLLKLLADFAKLHSEYYDTVRSELASWILHKQDPGLSQTAERLFSDLYRHFEAGLKAEAPEFTVEDWRSRLRFGDEVTEEEVKRLEQLLFGTTFLQESVMFAFDEPRFDLRHARHGGIWISKVKSRPLHKRFRLTINTLTGKHYDMQLVLSDEVNEAVNRETIFWLMSISSYPYEPRVLPQLGCCRLVGGARSMAYIREMTVWEKIREYESEHEKLPEEAKESSWRKLIVPALTAFVRAWHRSGKRIVPGLVAPENVMVSQQDFYEGAVVLSLIEWRHVKNTLSLVKPMIHNFFEKTWAFYPETRRLVKISWLFDAFVDELGMQEAAEFLEDLKRDLSKELLDIDDVDLPAEVDTYLTRLHSRYYMPMPLRNAIARYREWTRINPTATSEAKEQSVIDLVRLYQLERYPEIARYHLYRNTYFADSVAATRDAFDRLLKKLFDLPQTPALQLIELSDLQATIAEQGDRTVFSNMIFPKASQTRQLEVMAVGEHEEKHVIVRSTLTDKNGEQYLVREPLEPAEIGQLYRLFFAVAYPKTVSEGDQLLVVVDSQEQIIGGLCYRGEGKGVVYLDGSVITTTLQGLGLGTALLEDFYVRMANEGMRVIKTHFFLRRFLSVRGYTVDSKWGALVRFIESPDMAPKE